ncbi:hypothetical protein L1987_76634 [Smallanthus sonchifolius]|uniref:Uncharacterized protein n=1 Tax=Smallanthus sonchifolius TaxID=185202 RepID=A0ACB8ZC51_9ASTR|nr:hypothetical protein L1987_76634 [Smallanthus sonchifolius]
MARGLLRSVERERDDGQLRLWRRDSIGTMARNDFPRSETDGWRFGFDRDDDSDLAATTTEAATMVAMMLVEYAWRLWNTFQDIATTMQL